jgi:hypothetical protein
MTTDRKRHVIIVLEVNPDAEDDWPIEDAVRDVLEYGAISLELGERIVSIEVLP